VQPSEAIWLSHLLLLNLQRKEPHKKMKRLTAFIFVWIANFCLLAHAVIPHHHHHDEKIAIVGLTCLEEHNDIQDFNHKQDCDRNCYHNHPSQEHQPEACLISKASYLASRILKSGVGFSDEDTDYAFPLFCDVRKAVFHFISPYEKTQPTFFQTLFTLSKTSICSHGLRAPPQG
jgi:hypothetical protein